MARFLAVRFIQALLTLLAVSLVTFLMTHLSGNPVDVMLPIEAGAEERQALIERMGLDRPLAYQYLVFLRNSVQGDFGKSFRTKKPAMDLVKQRLPYSLKLATVSVVVSLLIGVPLGVIAAANRGRPIDRLATIIATLGQAVPTFWLGILTILLFGTTLYWLPVQGASSWKHYILPSLTMGWFTSAAITRLLRSGMLEVLDSEFVKLARTKGVSEMTIIWKHALRNALISTVTFLGFTYGILIAAAITTEVIFGWPGLGRLAYEATLWRDVPLLQAVVLVWTSLVVLINFLVDVLYVLIDPRIRV